MKKEIFIGIIALLIAAMPAYSQDKKTKKTKTKFDMNSMKDMMSGSGVPGMEGMGGMKPAEVEDAYEFQHSVDMKVESYNAKGVLDNTITYTMHLNEEANYFGMETVHEQGEGTLVFEIEKKRMVVMATSDEGKMGFVNTVTSYEPVEEDADDPDFKKTGETKVVLDKNCEEWAGKDEKHKYSAWMATDAPFTFAKAYQEMAKAQNKGKGSDTEYPDGMLMEMISTDLDRGTKTILSVTEIREDSNITISTAGWTFYEMGGY